MKEFGVQIEAWGPLAEGQKTFLKMRPWLPLGQDTIKLWHRSYYVGIFNGTW